MDYRLRLVAIVCMLVLCVAVVSCNRLPNIEDANLTLQDTDTFTRGRDIVTVTPEETVGERLAIKSASVEMLWTEARYPAFEGELWAVSSVETLSKLKALELESYNGDFFEENTLILIQYEHPSSVKIQGIEGIVEINGAVCPVLNVASSEDSTTDICYTLFAVSVSTADIKDMAMGSVFTINTLPDGHEGTFKGTVIK